MNWEISYATIHMNMLLRLGLMQFSVEDTGGGDSKQTKYLVVIGYNSLDYLIVPKVDLGTWLLLLPNTMRMNLGL